jgi:uncharacterized repeat protein (TIGR03847 family)
MPRRRFLFDTPERFVAGTVGEPGNRVFFLQAREGSRIVSIVLEKVQVAALVQRLVDLLEELERRGIAEPADAVVVPQDLAPLDEPLNEAFRAASLSIGWDGTSERVLVEAESEPDDEAEVSIEIEDEDEDEGGDLEGPDTLRVRLTPIAARSFIEGAVRLLASGRPPCPLCGQPLDPQGHLCPRRNGHLLN